MNPFFLALGCALISLVPAASPSDPFAHTYTREQPEPAELVGLYRLVRQNLDPGLDLVLRTEATGRGEHCRLMLQPDGTFLAHDFPVWTEARAGRYELASFDTFRGSWNLQIVGSVDDGATSTPVWGVSFAADGRPTVTANLAGESAPYTLHFGYGDPDSGDAMQYQSDRYPPESGEPDFTIVSAFFLLFFAAAAAVALGIAIVVVGCALLALAALAAVVCGAVLLAAAGVALVIGIVIVGSALLATAALAAAGCGAVLLAIAALTYLVRRIAAAARRDDDVRRRGRPAG